MRRVHTHLLRCPSYRAPTGLPFTHMRLIAFICLLWGTLHARHWRPCLSPICDSYSWDQRSVKICSYPYLPWCSNRVKWWDTCDCMVVVDYIWIQEAENSDWVDFKIAPLKRLPKEYNIKQKLNRASAIKSAHYEPRAPSTSLGNNRDAPNIRKKVAMEHERRCYAQQRSRLRNMKAKKRFLCPKLSPW